MRIHTNTLTEAEIKAAAKIAGVGIERFTTHKSRSHDHAYDIILSGAGRYGGQFGACEYKSATWDQWGIFLGHLYRDDTTVKAGPYFDAGDFNYKTGERFLYHFGYGLDLADQHIQHRWNFEYPYSFSCKCGATQNTR